MKSRWLDTRRDDAVDPITSEVIRNYISWLWKPMRVPFLLFRGAAADLLRFLVRPVHFRRNISPQSPAQSDVYLEELKYKQSRFGGGPF